MRRFPAWRALRDLLLTLLLVCLARTGFAASFSVVSGSMQPTLLIGDRMIAEPFAYGYSTASLPFGEDLPRGARLFGRVPARGDVVVFRSPSQPGVTWVKRVIGLPGDHVALRYGRLFLNGTAVAWRAQGIGREELADGAMVPAARFVETLPGGVTHPILKRFAEGPLDEVPDFAVPDGRVFVMGDDRDNSADSRVPVADGGVGLLPLWNLQGRVRLLTLSRDIVRPGARLVADPLAWLATIRPDRTLRIVH